LIESPPVSQLTTPAQADATGGDPDQRERHHGGFMVGGLSRVLKPDLGLRSGSMAAANAAALSLEDITTIGQILPSIATFGYFQHRLEQTSQCFVGQFGKLNMAEQRPVLGLFHCLPGGHAGQAPECLYLQKFIVGEGFKRTSEIRIGLRWIGLCTLRVVPDIP
jgi:hypothetical protein